MEEAWVTAIAALRAGLTDAFDALRARTECAEDGLRHRSEPGVWTALETLEHVHLTDRYLLVLVEKLARKSRSRAARGQAWPVHGPHFEHLGHIAGRELQWRAPEHMVPTGAVSAAAVREALRQDWARALNLLDTTPAGMGTLHRIRMSVVGGDDDRLDLYQYLEVVRLHAVRHIDQIDRALAAAKVQRT